MSNSVAFHTQLACIMEVLANAAVAEICELVDNGYAVLHLEISRSQKENESLRRKLRLMEMKVARSYALRAVGLGSSIFANSRTRAYLGNELKRVPSVAGSVPLSKVTPPQIQVGPIPLSDGADPTAVRPARQGTLAQPAAVEKLRPRSPVIKVEEDEGWERNTDPQRGPKEFIGPTDEGRQDSRNEPLISKHEVSAEATITSCSWMDGETNNSPILISDPKTLNSNKKASIPLLENSFGIPEPVVFNCVTFEPHIHHVTHGTQNPLIDDAGCSYSLNTNINMAAPSNLGTEFPYSIGELGLNEDQQNTDFVNCRQKVALPSSKEPLTDEKNGSKVSSALVLRDDWVSHDNYSNIPGYEQDDAGGKMFICNFCGKTLACLKNLKTHMRVHTGEKPFSCVQCGKRFSDSSNLKRHQSVHTGERRYGCIHCGKRFAQSGSLKVHMSVHLGCKQFKCPHCGKTFISANHLRRHVSVHDGEKQLPMSLQ